jgi:hypothetical protein
MIHWKTLTAAAAMAVGMFVGAAQAATCEYGDATDFSLFQADVYTSTACEGMISGNDSAATLNAYDPDGPGGNPAGIFGSANWVLTAKLDMPNPLGSYTGGTVGIFSMTINADGKSGTWSVSSWLGIEAATLVLKGGPNFAAYLLDLTAGLSGEWRTDALLVGNPQRPNTAGLSHISLYTTPAVIPVPAAGLLLLGALGGLAALRRRRRAA